MPQVSLYLDSLTMKKIEAEAKKDHVSISHWVRSKINKSLSEDWPENFSSLFGSIQDNSFNAPKSVSFNQDSPRVEL